MNLVVDEDDINGSDSDDEPVVFGGQQIAGRRPPLSDIDKVSLQIVFDGLGAELWDRSERITNVGLLLETDEFRHLSRQQVTTRFHMFNAEITNRHFFGTQFYDATTSMMEEENTFIEYHILSILSDWRRRYNMNVNPFNWMPDQLDLFLQRCEGALQAWTPGQSLEEVLSVEDHARMLSFANYFRAILLTTYCNTL
jgi:hypothetical protein